MPSSSELEHALSLLADTGGGGRGSRSGEMIIGHLSQLQGVVEILPAQEQAIFVASFIPWALKILTGTAIKMLEGSVEHRLRHGVLVTLKTMSGLNEPLRPFLDQLLPALCGILQEDNEENAIVAVHIIIDLNKVHRLLLEPYAQTLVDFVLASFEAFPDNCEAVFETLRGGTSSRRGTRSEGVVHPPLLKATNSFKVLIECPVMVVLLFQIHRKLIADNINRFAPLVVKALAVAIEPPAPPKIQTGVELENLGSSPNGATLHQAFADFVSAQVKTLSFLAYISRGFAAIIRPHYPLIPTNVIRLLRVCPADCPSARKELLVATRHILSTEIRQAFVPFLEELLDDGLLLGDGFTSFYVLRPLALSMLADLVHHVRTEIKLPVLVKIVQMYSQALHDPSLPVGVQTMSAKLLVNLVDSMLVEDVGSPKDRRVGLHKILFALLAKFEWIAAFVGEARERGSAVARQYNQYFDDPLNSRPIDTDAIAMDPNRDNFRDFKFLLKTLIGGLKNVIFALKTMPVQGGEGTPLMLFTAQEGAQFVSLMKNGIRAFDIFRLADEEAKPTEQMVRIGSPALLTDAVLSTVSVHGEEKEIYEQFGYLFTILDPHLFQEVLGSNLDFLVASMASNHSLLILPQYFLAISGISRNFAGLLIRHLMDHFDDLVSEDAVKGAIALRLFKLIFLAVSVYPDENESVLQPYLMEIIMNCLKRHQHSAHSLNYFLLLRSLFRSIGGGRFDALYKEVLPLLPIILEELGKLPSTTTDPLLRELYVELCLTTPVRLSVLLPYLSHLMKPLVLALQSSPDLVSQGLRTLELCIDNLTQDFLEPIVFPVLEELLGSLWGLLKPPPANQAHSHAAMRILGKMGGRAHRYLALPRPLGSGEGLEDSMAFSLVLNFDSTSVELPFDQVILSATRVLDPMAKVTMEQKRLALGLLASSIKALVFAGPAASSEAHSLRLPFHGHLAENPVVNAQLSQEVTDRLAGITRNDPSWTLSRSFCASVVSAMFFAAASEDLGPAATAFLADLYSIMAICLVKPDLLPRQLPSPDLFFDTLIDVACDDESGRMSIIVASIIHRLEQVNRTWCPQECLILSVLLEKLITSCYRVKAVDKIRVIRLIGEVCQLDLDLAWVWVYEVRLTRGFLYAMKSLPSGLSALQGQEIRDTLIKFLKLCNRQEDRETPETKARRNQFFTQLVTLLVSELSNANNLVRTAVQGCFQLLADLTGAEVTELLLPMKERLLTPIFTKPLRALPPNLQIGYIDAITYCLSLRPPLLEVNDELLRLLNEAFALSEADDSFLATKTNQIQNSACILQLRLVCIRLLSIALATTEFQLPKHQGLRNQIVALFFKSLYSRSPEVVEASRRALEQVMVNQHKLPKELLQTALRPVLTNLAEAKRLTLPGLEGLRRVLELLTSYFKSEIGKKLLDHLAAWAEPKKPLQDASGRPLCECLEVRVIASILDIFHLLPPSGHVFVSELIVVVINLESMILRNASSPFRPPLQRLLAHYPAESADYMLAHVDDLNVLEIFAHVLHMDASEPIVDALVPHVDAILQQFKRQPASRYALLGVLEPVLLRTPSAECLRSLDSLWDCIIRTASQEGSGSLESVQEARELCRIAVRLLEGPRTDLKLHLSFMMLSVIEFSYLAVPLNFPAVLRQSVDALVKTDAAALLRAWSAYHQAKELPVSIKMRAIRLLLLPALAILKDAMVETDLTPVVEGLAGLHLKAPHEASMLAVKEIQIMTLLLQLGHRSDALEDLLLSRAQLLDPSTRFACYSSIVGFLGGVDQQLLLRLLPSVLKMPTSEARPVVRQALQSVLQALVASEEQWPPAAEIISSVLVKEAYSAVLISVIWQSLIELRITPSGLAFVSSLKEALYHTFIRSSQPVLLVAESRSLPFELLDLIVEVSGDTIPPIIAETISNVCLKLLLSLGVSSTTSASAQPDQATTETIYNRGLDVFLCFLRLYPSISVCFAPFERVFSVGSLEAEDQAVTGQKFALKLLKSILETHQPLNETEMNTLGTLLMPLLTSASYLVCPDLCDVLSVLFASLPNDSSLVGHLKTWAADALAFGKSTPVALLIASRLSDLQADDKVVGSLTKLLPRLCRDYLSKHDASLSAGAAEVEFMSKFTIVPIIRLLIGVDSARACLLSAIQMLWEKSMDKMLLSFLLDLFIDWVSPSQHGILSVSEVSDLLLTPSKLDQIREEALMERYLDLILCIYQNPSYQGTELTNRLEGSFLQGLASPTKRPKFIALLHGCVSESVAIRLPYLLGGIRWNLCGNSFNWIPPLAHLLMLCSKSFAGSRPLQSPSYAQVLADAVHLTDGFVAAPNLPDAALPFLEHFFYHDDKMASRLWVELFPRIWATLGDNERDLISRAITKLLATQESLVSMEASNPISCILAAACACADPPRIPPHLLRFTAQRHKTWYSSLSLLEASVGNGPVGRSEELKAACLLYRDLSETDMLYGALIRGSTLPESSSCLSFAQTNRWLLTQKIAEGAQEATRIGTLPYNEAELGSWEDAWIEAAKKLQQWDLVTEVAKVESDVDLNLECIWRLGDWMQGDTVSVAEGLLKACAEPQKPRTKFLEAFLILNNIREQGPDRHVARFQNCIEEAIQGSLQAWNLLPAMVSRSHVPQLHTFQMYVELQEAMTIYSGIAGGPGNPASLINRPQFLTDLKGLLSTWRERLPNRMDDLNIWSDLLAWRQHIFSALNTAFQSPSAANGGDPAGGAGAPSAQSHPFAYRGYHELAWLINKFARVCRKNGMPEACLSFLNRIYTLPNIEIQDAFSKLKEQTLCYVDQPSELPTALEVINATNLNYFNPLQKAEFFAMKGQILSRLGMVEDANRVFAQAVQIDLNIGKGWAYWGQFNDQRFQQSHDITLAVSAINCYLQAATLYKIAKARKFGARILWLLTFEDAVGSMAKSFELYNNDLPTWFWVIFIPQLLSSLSRKEARHARFLLIKIAKSFPQALYLPLRTAADEFRLTLQQSSSLPAPPAPTPQTQSPPPESTPAEGLAGADQKRSPVEYTDDLLAILKTGYPLLALSMENMVEHIVQRLRSTADEDLYRVVVTLLSEAFQQMMIRFNSASEGITGNGMEPSLRRVSQMLASSPYLASTYKQAFDEDFGSNQTLSLDIVIGLLEVWKGDLERVIKRCPASFSLESLSRFLAEFEYQRYDEVEVPGQYQQLRDNNVDFLKIDRFEPTVEIVRRHGASFRQIAIRASNGSLHRFIVQNPSARQSRREEKIMQFFRTIKRSLKENPNSRRRGLDFVVPLIVPVSAHVRLIQDETDQVSLEEVYERHCRLNGVEPDDVLISFRDTLQSELSRLGIQLRKGNVEVLNLRVDIFQHLSSNVITSDILSKYISALSPSADQYWIFRQTFARQYAGTIFLSYVMALGHRYPHKISFTKKSATVINTEILPTLNPNGQITLVEAVPFRLTPNIQEFLTPLVIEGVLIPAVHSCAEVFFKPESELGEFLPMVIRDELISWVLLNQPPRPRFAQDADGRPIPNTFKHDLEILEQLNIDERQFLGRVIQNCELTMKRCQTLACIKETEKASDGKTSALQTILDLVSCATNPQKLALMDAHWHPWL